MTDEVKRKTKGLSTSSILHPSSNPFVILIQDAHANPEAQANVKAILEFLAARYPKMAIAVEGAAGPLHPEYFDFFREYPEAGHAAVQDLQKKGELNGAELFLWEKYQTRLQTTDSLTPSLSLGERKGEGKLQSPVSSLRSLVYGVEDLKLYRDDLQVYRELLFRQDEIGTLLNPIRAELEKQSSRVFSPELRNFLKERERRKEGKYSLVQPAQDPNLEAYLTYLQKTVLKSLAIDLSDPFEQLRFPNLFRLHTLRSTKKELDPAKVVAEWQNFLNDLNKQFPDEGGLIAALRYFAAANGFLGNEKPTGDLRIAFDRELLPRKLLEYLFYLDSKNHFGLSNYKQVLQSFKPVILQAELDAAELFEEIGALEDLLIEKLAVTDHEKRFVNELRAFSLFEKLLKLELTRRDHEAVLRNPKIFDEFLHSSKALETFFSKALEFYRLAGERDQALVKNALAFLKPDDGKWMTDDGNPKTTSDILHPLSGVIVLITGGFHTDGISGLLKQRGIGHAVITPRITRTDRGELYRKTMTGENADLSAYFKVKNPFRTKQEALLFKQVLEVAAPVLFEKYQLKPFEIARNVKQAFVSNPVLSRAALSESLEDPAALRFTPRSRVTALPSNAAIPSPLNFGQWNTAGAATNTGFPAVVTFGTKTALKPAITQDETAVRHSETSARAEMRNEENQPVDPQKMAKDFANLVHITGEEVEVHFGNLFGTIREQLDVVDRLPFRSRPNEILNALSGGRIEEARESVRILVDSLTGRIHPKYWDRLGVFANKLVAIGLLEQEDVTRLAEKIKAMSERLLRETQKITLPFPSATPKIKRAQRSEMRKKPEEEKLFRIFQGTPEDKTILGTPVFHRSSSVALEEFSARPLLFQKPGEDDAAFAERLRIEGVKKANEQFEAGLEIVKDKLETMRQLVKAEEAADERAKNDIRRLRIKLARIQGRLDELRKDPERHGIAISDLEAEESRAQQQRYLALSRFQNRDQKIDHVQNLSDDELKRHQSGAALLFLHGELLLEIDVMGQWLGNGSTEEAFSDSRKAFVEKMVRENVSLASLFDREVLSVKKKEKADRNMKLASQIDAWKQMLACLEDVFSSLLQQETELEEADKLSKEEPLQFAGDIILFLEREPSVDEFKTKISPRYGSQLAMLVVRSAGGGQVSSGATIIGHLKAILGGMSRPPALASMPAADFDEFREQIQKKKKNEIPEVIVSTGRKGDEVLEAENGQLVLYPSEKTYRKKMQEMRRQIFWNRALRRQALVFKPDLSGFKTNSIPGELTSLEMVARLLGSERIGIGLQRTEVMMPGTAQAVLRMVEGLGKSLLKEDTKEDLPGDAADMDPQKYFELMKKIYTKTLTEMASWRDSPLVRQLFASMEKGVEEELAHPVLAGQILRKRTFDLRADKNPELFRIFQAMGIVTDPERENGYEIYRKKAGRLLMILQLAVYISAIAKGSGTEHAHLQIILPTTRTPEDILYFKEVLLPVARELASYYLLAKRPLSEKEDQATIKALVDSAVERITFGSMLETGEALHDHLDAFVQDPLLKVYNYGLNDAQMEEVARGNSLEEINSFVSKIKAILETLSATQGPDRAQISEWAAALDHLHQKTLNSSKASPARDFLREWDLLTADAENKIPGFLAKVEPERKELVKRIAKITAVREDYWMAVVAGHWTPELLKLIDSTAAKFQEYNQSRPVSERKTLCFCGELAQKPQFAFLQRHLEQKYPDTPFSRSMSPLFLPENVFFGELARSLPWKRIQEIFSSYDHLTETKALQQVDSLLAIPKSLMTTIEDWQERYRAAGFYLTFYRTDIDPAQGIGSMEEFDFIKSLAILLSKMPQKSGLKTRLEPLQLSKEQDMTPDDLPKVLDALQGDLVMRPDERAQIEKAFRFLSQVRDLFDRKREADPEKYDKKLHAGNLDDFLNSFESDDLSVPGAFLDEKGLQRRRQEFYNIYYRHANNAFNALARLAHVSLEEVFPPQYELPILKKNLQSEEGDIEIQSRKRAKGWLYERHEGFVIKDMTELTVFALPDLREAARKDSTLLDQVLGKVLAQSPEYFKPGLKEVLGAHPEFLAMSVREALAREEISMLVFERALEKHPDFVVDVFQQTVRPAAQEQIRISYRLQRTLTKMIQTMPRLEKMPPQNRLDVILKMTRLFMSNGDISYGGVWRAHRFRFFDVLLEAWAETRNVFLDKVQRFAVHMQTLQSFEFMEKLIDTKSPALLSVAFAFRNIRHVSTEKTDILALRIAMLMDGMIRVRFREVIEHGAPSKSGIQEFVSELFSKMDLSEMEKELPANHPEKIDADLLQEKVLWLCYNHRILSMRKISTPDEVTNAISSILNHLWDDKIQKWRLDARQLLNMLYVMVISSRISLADPDKVPLRMREGPDGTLARWKIFYSAATSMVNSDLPFKKDAEVEEGRKPVSYEEIIRRNVRNAYETIKKRSNPEEVEKKLIENMTGRNFFEAVANDYLTRNVPLSYRDRATDEFRSFLQKPENFKKAFNFYKETVSPYAMRSREQNPGDLLRQILFFNHVKTLNAQKDYNTVPVLITPFPTHGQNVPCEILIGSGDKSPHLDFFFAATLFKNRFLIEDITEYPLADGKGTVLRFLGFFEGEAEQDLAEAEKGVRRDLDEIFKISPEAKDRDIARLRKMNKNEKYKTLTIVKRSGTQMQPSQISFSRDLEMENASVLTILTPDRPGLYSFVRGVFLKEFPDIRVLQKRFKDLDGGLPRMDFYLTNLQGRPLSIAQESEIANKLKDWLDRNEVKIRKGKVLTARAELRITKDAFLSGVPGAVSMLLPRRSEMRDHAEVTRPLDMPAEEASKIRKIFIIGYQGLGNEQLSYDVKHFSFFVPLLLNRFPNAQIDITVDHPNLFSAKRYSERVSIATEVPRQFISDAVDRWKADDLLDWFINERYDLVFDFTKCGGSLLDSFFKRTQAEGAEKPFPVIFFNMSPLPDKDDPTQRLPDPVFRFDPNKPDGEQLRRVQGTENILRLTRKGKEPRDWEKILRTYRELGLWTDQMDLQTVELGNWGLDELEKEWVKSFLEEMFRNKGYTDTEIREVMQGSRNFIYINIFSRAEPNLNNPGVWAKILSGVLEKTDALLFFSAGGYKDHPDEAKLRSLEKQLAGQYPQAVKRMLQVEELPVSKVIQLIRAMDFVVTPDRSGFSDIATVLNIPQLVVANEENSPSATFREKSLIAGIGQSDFSGSVVALSKMLAERKDPSRKSVLESSGLSTVLWAEDEPHNRRLFKMMLERIGVASVETAEDGQKALEMLLANPSKYDLVITDNIMPVMDGVTFLEEAQKKGLLNMPVIVASGALQDPSVAARLKVLKNPPLFLSKPFGMEGLQDALGTAKKKIKRLELRAEDRGVGFSHETGKNLERSEMRGPALSGFPEVERPLDMSPEKAAQINRVFVLGLKGIEYEKLGEDAILFVLFIEQIIKKFPNAKIYIAIDYINLLSRERFRGKVFPVVDPAYESERQKKDRKPFEPHEGILTHVNVPDGAILEAMQFEPDKLGKWLAGFDMIFDFSGAGTLMQSFFEKNSGEKNPVIFSHMNTVVKRDVASEEVQGRPVTMLDSSGLRNVKGTGKVGNLTRDGTRPGYWEKTYRVYRELGLYEKGFDLQLLNGVQMPLSEMEKRWVLETLKGMFAKKQLDAPIALAGKEKFIYVNIFSQGNSGFITPAMWIKILSGILQAQEVYLVFSQGGFKDQVNQPVLEDILKELSRVVGPSKARFLLEVPENISVGRVQEIMQIMDFVITPDTGFSHLATAFNIPQVEFMIFPKHSSQWGTYRKNSLIVDDDFLKNLLQYPEAGHEAIRGFITGSLNASALPRRHQVLGLGGSSDEVKQGTGPIRRAEMRQPEAKSSKQETEKIRKDILDLNGQVVNEVGRVNLRVLQTKRVKEIPGGRSLYKSLNNMKKKTMRDNYIGLEDLEFAQRALAMFVSNRAHWDALDKNALDVLNSRLEHFIANRKKLDELYEKLGDDRYARFSGNAENQAILRYIQTTGAVWMIDLPRFIESVPAEQADLINLLKGFLEPLGAWFLKPGSISSAKEQKPEYIAAILNKLHKYERTASGEIIPRPRSFETQDMIGLNHRREVFHLAEGLSFMIEASKNLKWVQGELSFNGARSELRGTTAKIKDTMLKVGMRGGFDLVNNWLRSEIRIPVAMAAEVTGGNYSRDGVAFYTGDRKKAELYIAAQLTENLSAKSKEQGISNPKLKRVVAKIVSAIPASVKLPSSAIEQGPVVHLDLSFLTPEDWQDLAQSFPVVLANLVSLNGKLMINVNSTSIRPEELQLEVRLLAEAQGIKLAPDQIAIVGVKNGQTFASLAKLSEADALMAGSEEAFQNVRYEAKIGSRWVAESASTKNMPGLAAEISTVLYAALDQKVDRFKSHKPSEYNSGALLQAVFTAVQAYLQIRVAA